MSRNLTTQAPADEALARSGLAIRECASADDPQIARVIRQVMPEFGAQGPGYAINDPEVDHMSRAYAADRSAYYVVTRDDVVLGGGGYAPLAGGDDAVCELRKMYFLPEARGLGVGRKLLLHILSEARKSGYSECYLETLEHMHQARALYASVGFEALCEPRGSTGHFGCDSWMLLRL